jgi:hypothetical protein
MLFSVERIFNPVGQGGFYEERFFYGTDRENIFNFVFDCGTENRQDLFRDILNEKSYDTVHLLCISHFDNDHVSLLPSFLNGKHIETLVMPLLSEAQKAFYLLSDIDKADGDDDSIARNTFSSQYTLLFDPRGFMRSIEATVNRIVYIEEGSENHQSESLEISEIEELRDELSLPSGVELAPGKFSATSFRWIFKPINISFAEESRGDDLQKALYKLIKDDERYKDAYDRVDAIFLRDAIGDHELIKLIRKAYYAVFKKIDRKMNDYSMALYSGLHYDACADVRVDVRNIQPHRRECRCMFCRLPHRCHRCEDYVPCFPHDFCRNHSERRRYTSKTGCLYLGDYNAKKHIQEIEKYYHRYIERSILTLQIPHHGSKHSWNTRLLDWAEDFVVSYGSNGYWHPSSKVLLDVVNSRKRLFEITHLEHSALKHLIIVSVE